MYLESGLGFCHEMLKQVQWETIHHRPEEKLFPQDLACLAMGRV